MRASTATTEETFICTWAAGFRAVTTTRFAAEFGCRPIASAQADTIANTPGALIAPFGPVAVHDSTVVIQRAPALLGTIAG